MPVSTGSNLVSGCMSSEDGISDTSGVEKFLIARVAFTFTDNLRFIG